MTILRVLAHFGHTRAVCVDAERAQGWVTTVGEPDALRYVHGRVHVLTPTDRLVTLNVVRCDCQLEHATAGGCELYESVDELVDLNLAADRIRHPHRYEEDP